jgi:hypothetical protein
MAFKAIVDLDCDTTTALGGTDKTTRKLNPTKAEGYYLGSKTVASAKSKTGTAQIHVFKTPSGNLGVWGKTNLDSKMAGAIVGMMTRVIQKGKAPTNKGNDMFLFQVSQDDENTIEVNPPSVQSAGAAAAEGDVPDFDPNSQEEEEEGNQDDDPEADEPPADEPPPTRASAPRRAAPAPTAASAKNTRDFLNSRRPRA